MAKKGLKSWVRANWVDIANRRPDGSFLLVVDPKVKKEKNYPKCLPIAKARSMSKSQRAAAVSRKKKAEARTRKGKKPNYART